MFLYSLTIHQSTGEHTLIRGRATAMLRVGGGIFARDLRVTRRRAWKAPTCSRSPAERTTSVKHAPPNVVRLLADRRADSRWLNVGSLNPTVRQSPWSEATGRSGVGHRPQQADPMLRVELQQTRGSKNGKEPKYAGTPAHADAVHLATATGPEPQARKSSCR